MGGRALLHSKSWRISLNNLKAFWYHCKLYHSNKPATGNSKVMLIAKWYLILMSHPNSPPIPVVSNFKISLSILKIKKYINVKNIYFLVPWKWMIWKTKRKLYKQIKQQVKEFPRVLITWTRLWKMESFQNFQNADITLTYKKDDLVVKSHCWKVPVLPLLSKIFGKVIFNKPGYYINSFLSKLNRWFLKV